MDETARGREELRAIRKESRQLFWAVGIFSVFVNLLMLTGPIFMLQVYDRVLGSRSVETLVALVMIMAFLFLMMGLLDYARGRILARIGARFQAKLDRRVFDAMLRHAAATNAKHEEQTANHLSDLESIQKVLASPVLTAIFDMPWTPVFLVGIAIFHPWLGMLAIVGGGLLIVVTIVNQVTTRRPQAMAGMAAMEAGRMSDQMRGEAEMVRSLGMQEAVFARWQQKRDNALALQVSSSDLTGGYSSMTKTFRLFLQSAMLGLGALLVLREELTPGAMIAASILLGRALAPIDIAVGQWPAVQRAQRGWSSVAELLAKIPPALPKTALPRPRAHLQAIQATVLPPGEQQAALRLVSFEVKPGQAVGVIGPSGAGKSTLARAITGTWKLAGGKIRLDGAALDQYEPDVLAQHIGYLPQRVHLFEGTIAENIARMSPEPDAKRVVEAAQKADAHEMILKMVDGYDTRLTASGGRLSGGEMQRIGLARALYGDPVILVLDEPNSNLDNRGSEAVNATIRRMKEEGRSVMIMAHRPAAIQECDQLLMLDGGAVRAFGPRDEVLAKVVANNREIAAQAGMGGVT